MSYTLLASLDRINVRAGVSNPLSANSMRAATFVVRPAETDIILYYIMKNK
jgi:hypothetical protein